jgi:AraC family transcriptional regulator
MEVALSMSTFQLQCAEYLGVKDAMSQAEGLWVSITKYEALAKQPWHTHSNPTFFIQLRGEHLDETTAYSAIQEPLAVSFHPTWAAHRSHTGPKGMAGVNVELTPEWLARYSLQERDLGQVRISKDPSHQFRAAQLSIAIAGGESHLDDLVFEVVEPFVLRQVPAGAPPNWLHSVREIISREYGDKLSLPRIAEAVAVHPVYLARSFRQHFGKSVLDHILETRLSAACRLMLQGVSAGEASLACGFADQFHLSRTMVKRMGFSPSQIKRLGNT